MNSDLLAEVIKESGQAKKEDFFVLVGSGKISPQHVVQRIIQGLNREGEPPSTAASTSVRSSAEENVGEGAGL